MKRILAAIAIVAAVSGCSDSGDTQNKQSAAPAATGAVQTSDATPASGAMALRSQAAESVATIEYDKRKLEYQTALTAYRSGKSTFDSSRTQLAGDQLAQAEKDIQALRITASKAQDAFTAARSQLLKARSSQPAATAPTTTK